MAKCSTKELRLLAGLSKILDILNGEEIEIEKQEENGNCIFLGIKDVQKNLFILNVHNVDKDKISGSYPSWINKDHLLEYSITRLHNDIFILQEDANLKILKGNVGYADSIDSIIENGVTTIGLSYIEDLQILTDEEAKNGMQLVKQIKSVKK